MFDFDLLNVLLVKSRSELDLSWSANTLLRLRFEYGNHSVVHLAKVFLSLVHVLQLNLEQLNLLLQDSLFLLELRLLLSDFFLELLAEVTIHHSGSS